MLTGADLREADLRGTDLRGAVLDGVDLAAARLGRTLIDLGGAVLLAEASRAVVDLDPDGGFGASHRGA